MMTVVERAEEASTVRQMLARSPVVAILGARQVGKTTLAREIARAWSKPVTFFDLEDPRDLARLQDPMLALESLRGLVVLDEIQRAPNLFPVLRVLADRRGAPARFLVLGSASPALLRQGSESLAGRIAWHELDGFSMAEVGPRHFAKLWLRGGFPRSFLARTNADSAAWRHDFVQTFLERDLAQLGFGIPATAMRRFWSMVAHWHGQIWNASEIARSIDASDATARRYLDALAGSFVVRVQRPFFENVAKRQVKSPRVWIADPGLLHTLLGLETRTDVERHPKLGASWEGFVVGELLRHLGARRDEAYFWATHAGAELDLLVVRGRVRRGFEVKRTSTPRVTKSMRTAMETLGLETLDVVHGGKDTFPLTDRIRAVAAARLLEDVRPL